MPAHRTPAQIEAARRKARPLARPRYPDGKARSSMNALKHGLAAADHLLLEGEDPGRLRRTAHRPRREIEPAPSLEPS
jgi:hypothetical protein